MKNKVNFWKEAVKDYKKLDGATKKWVNLAIERLEEKGSSIGKKLGNTQYAKLVGFSELKNQRLGIRLIYRTKPDNKIEIIEIVIIGKREDEKVVITADKRINKHSND